MRETCIKCAVQNSPEVWLVEFAHTQQAKQYIVYVCQKCLEVYEPMTPVVVQDAARGNISQVQSRDATLGIRRESDRSGASQGDSAELRAVEERRREVSQQKE